MQLFYKLKSLQNYLLNVKSSTAFIPTMGGLHKGHLSLIETGKQYAECTIVSIFVNKEQFGAHEDFDAYPRTPDEDIALLTAIGVDILFMPSHLEIYPQNYTFSYDIGNLEYILCGRSRPGHFQGVTKIVYRLFDIIKPTYAVFGQKDYQQLIIIKQMVAYFSLDTIIIEGDIKRDEAGLALSTRNKYLTTSELDTARTFNNILKSITQYTDIHQGIVEIRHTLSEFFVLDYCEVLDADNLGKITNNTNHLIILAAVFIGSVRLIDNFAFKSKQHS